MGQKASCIIITKMFSLYVQNLTKCSTTIQTQMPMVPCKCLHTLELLRQVFHWSSKFPLHLYNSNQFLYLTWFANQWHEECSRAGGNANFWAGAGSNKSNQSPICLGGPLELPKHTVVTAPGVQTSHPTADDPLSMPLPCFPLTHRSAFAGRCICKHATD